jgi:LmbE family N-acetylglucosaminyl deacetylase
MGYIWRSGHAAIGADLRGCGGASDRRWYFHLGRLNSWRTDTATATQPDTALKTDRPLSPLEIPDVKLDIGKVWEAKDALVTVLIHNRTVKAIEITEHETACDCQGVFPR